MSIVMQINPFEFFTDTLGDALDAGYIWIGQPNTDPRQYPVIAYYDAELATPAVMPLRTVSGYIARNGSPAFLYISGNYSVMVLNKNQELIYYVPNFLLSGSGSAVSLGDLQNTTDPTKGISIIPTASRLVSNIASLRTLPKTGGSLSAFVQGYYAIGDGGGGHYYLDQSDTVSLDNGGAIIVAADGGRWKIVSTDEISVKQFGAKMDGATNDSAAFQAAGDWLISIGGGKLRIPTGQLFLTSGVAWSGNSLHIQGDGLGASQIRCGFADGDIICIGDGVANPNNCSVSHLTMISNIAKTSGAGIRFRNGHNLRASNVRIDTNMYIGIQLDGGAQQFGYFVDTFEISGNTYGIMLGNGPVTQDVWIDRGVIGGSLSSGLLMVNISGIYMSNIDFIGCFEGVSTFPGAGQSVGALWAHTVLTDTCTDNGWNILTNGGACFEWNMVNCWGSSSTNNGMVFNGNLRAFAITNARVINNRKSGILLTAGEDFTFNNCHVLSNSQGTPNTFNGLEIAAGVSQFSVIGGVYGKGGQFPVNNQRYGIAINGGASDYFNVIGANLLDNATGPMSDGSSGTNKSIYGNAGYKTSNNGIASIGAGSSSVVVNHGLNATPSQGDISVTPTVDLNIVGISRFWISAATATNFTIQCNAAATGTGFFAWQVRTSGA